MRKVYQTIIDKGNGNCLQAVMASLLNYDLDQVPHFIAADDWADCFHNWLESQGLEYEYTLYNPKNLGAWGDDRLLEALGLTEGIDGYFYAAVYSPNNFDANEYCKGNTGTHAVVVDKYLNVVHDPNPEYSSVKEYPLAQYLGHNGIIHVCVITRKSASKSRD